MPELDDQERTYLRTLVARRHSELLHELHHAVTLEFKAGLRKEIELTDALLTKLG
jgi:hypothetical protein